MTSPACKVDQQRLDGLVKFAVYGSFFTRPTVEAEPMNCKAFPCRILNKKVRLDVSRRSDEDGNVNSPRENNVVPWLQTRRVLQSRSQVEHEVGAVLA